MEERGRTVGVGSWIFTLFMLAIPLVNIIYCIVLIFGGSKYKSKVNLFRAYLVLIIIGIVLFVVAANMLFGSVKELLTQIIEYINSLFSV